MGGDGDKSIVHDGIVDGEEDQADDQPDQVQGEGSNPLTGRFERHGCYSPAESREQCRYFTQVLLQWKVIYSGGQR